MSIFAILSVITAVLIPAYAQAKPLKESGSVQILYPAEGTLFPSDIRSPLIRWEDRDPRHHSWVIHFKFRSPKSGGANELRFESELKQWEPSREIWEEIKRKSVESSADLTIQAKDPGEASSAAKSRIRFSTSKDAVGAPIIFRAVPNPFPDKADYVKIKWKQGWVSSYDPPLTIMDKQVRCFNCHVASLDGQTFGFEHNQESEESNRGGYILFKNPGKVVKWTPGNFFDWNHNPRLSKDETRTHQALLSSLSPDGRYLVTGGNAKTSVELDPKGVISYTLLTKSILLYMSTDDRQIRALPGADNEKLIQGLPTSWSPDGKYVYFSRAAITPQLEKLNQRNGIEESVKKAQNQMNWEEVDKLYDLKYDVYRIPFNGGKGGKAIPLAGAARNGKSNYYAKASPDGKWVVFTQSRNGTMLVRMDSDLYIVPAAGGKARKLKANGPGADSWHSWSPNGRWLVFSSKREYPSQTDLLLTHIDERGNDSAPVVLTHFRDEGGLSANIPEFFNIKPGQIEKIDPTGIKPITP